MTIQATLPALPQGGDRHQYLSETPSAARAGIFRRPWTIAEFAAILVDPAMLGARECQVCNIAAFVD